MQFKRRRKLIADKRYKVLKFPDFCSEEDIAKTLNIWSEEHAYSVITSWYQQGDGKLVSGKGVVVMEKKGFK